jgi:hypothetical protein
VANHLTMTDYNIPIPRSVPDIVARLKRAQAEGDFFGAEAGRLADALSFADVLSHDLLSEEGKQKGEAGWDAGRLKTIADVRKDITDYLPFAWGKANGCRSLSASRSIGHFRGLLWLHGPDGAAIADRPEFNDAYEFYGKPALVLVSEFVGFNWEAADDNCWRNGEDERGIRAKEALGR